MRQRRNVGLRALIDAAGINQPPTPYRAGLRARARASMPAAASAMRRWARGCCRSTTRRKRRASPSSSTSSTASARPSRRRCSKRPSPKPIVWSTRRRTCRCWWSAPSAGTRASSGSSRAGSSSGSAGRRASSPGKRGGQGTGSLRSIADVDIGAAVRAATADGLLVKGGGHAMAAGLTVARDKLDALARLSRRRAQVSRVGCARRADARDRWRADAGGRQRHADRSDRTRRTLRPGQSAAALRLSRPSRAVRQGDGRGAPAHARSKRTTAAGSTASHSAPSASRSAICSPAPAGCRSMSPAACAATPGAAAIASNCRSRTPPIRASRIELIFGWAPQTKKGRTSVRPSDFVA